MLSTCLDIYALAFVSLQWCMVDPTIFQDFCVNDHVIWQEIRISASNDSSSILMAYFQSLFLYLHYEGSMDECWNHLLKWFYCICTADVYS